MGINDFESLFYPKHCARYLHFVCLIHFTVESLISGRLRNLPKSTHLGSDGVRFQMQVSLTIKSTLIL